MLFKFQRGRVSVLWREWMFGVLAALYANERTFYRLEVGGYALDNPDQRIAEDTRAFTAVSLDFAISVPLRAQS